MTPKRLGVLARGTEAELAEEEQLLSTYLTRLGWIVGKTLIFERGYTDDPQNVAGLAAELVKRKVDVILTGGTLTTLAAARATQNIPIVFSSVHYPLEHGLVQSFAHPGGNVTGPALFNGIDLTIKRLDFLRQVAPTAKRLSWVWPAELMKIEKVHGGYVDMGPVLKAGAIAQGFEPRLHVMGAAQIESQVFADILEGRAQAICGSVYGDPAHIVSFALSHGLPTAFPMRYFATAGGLLTYGPRESDGDALTELAASYIHRILSGARASDWPIVMPSKYELVINLKTAKALQLSIPKSLLLLANDVIE